MSRVLKNLTIPAGVEVSVSGKLLTVKGSKGTLEREVHSTVAINKSDAEIGFLTAEGANHKDALPMIGTTRSLVNSMFVGVTEGFEKKLQLVGVGYRAAAKGNGTVDLTLGFSHPVVYEAPEGVTIETPSQTEILVKGVDKQKVGQVAANIRAFRPPEPYKGKGVRYADERIIRKEAKKK